MALSTLKREVALMQATVEEEPGAGRWYVLQICAPKGKSWICAPGLHMLRVEYPVGSWVRSSPEWQAREASIKDAITRIRMGLEDCTIEHCDYCSENDGAMDDMAATQVNH